MEFLPGNWRPLDALRFKNIWLAILRDLVLLFIFFTWGSLDKYGCFTAFDERCTYMYYCTFAAKMPWWCALYMGSFAMIFLVLLSDAAQWVLASLPFQFMG